MATSEEKQDLINDIKYPYKYYRIKVYGHGGDNVLYKLDKHGFDYWTRALRKNPSAILDYFSNDLPIKYEDGTLVEIPPYARFLDDRNYSKVGIEYGTIFSTCDISVTQTDGDDIGSNDIKTIIKGTPVASLNCPIIYEEQMKLPAYVLSHNRHEVGYFIECILRIDHKFDIKHVTLPILERAKGDIVLKGINYKDQKLRTSYGYTKINNESTDIWKT